MLERIVAGALWAIFGWYLAAHLASLTGVSLELAPIGALVMAVIAFVDWRSLIRRAPTMDSPGAVRVPR